MCMADSPTTGVVGSDCRVWGTANVFIGGAAVFPSSGHANTTLTALALVARLAPMLAAKP
jgi:choline dehydrogenase-like flavoprotein